MYSKTSVEATALSIGGWQFVLIVFITQIVCLALVGTLAFIFGKTFVRNRLRHLFEDSYTSNLWEGVTGLRHLGVQWTMENELRSARPEALQKPLGTHRTFPHFDGLLFSPAQLYRRALDSPVPVNIETLIGKRCERPLRISMPIMVSAMGYGVALDKPFSMALARGTAMAGTAFNTGQGPVLQEHREKALRMIVQYHGAPWRPPDEMLSQADMIEIRFGQGANGGVASSIDAQQLPEYVLQDMGIHPGDDARIPAGIPGISRLNDLRKLVRRLRELGRGVPIAIKLAASHHLERDLRIALEAEVDVLVLDGAQGGTHGSTAILVDDFGLPTLAALCRAERFLSGVGVRNDVSLVVSGGIRTPGDALKAVALGADAVYLGSAALFATTHTQILKPLPLHPPTQIAWANGLLSGTFDEEKGANTLANFLTSCAEEIKIGLRALGKNSVDQLVPNDLVAWDPLVAQITGVESMLSPTEDKQASEF